MFRHPCERPHQINRLRVAVLLFALGCWQPVALFGEEQPAAKPDVTFRITQLPGEAVPLPTDGFSVRQMNSLWHDGRYYVYADVIGWDNPHHPASYNNSIGVYSSPDGVNWMYHGEILSPGAAGDWDYGDTICPGATKFQGKFHVAYSGVEQKNNVGKRLLGLAVADNPLGPFRKLPGPIFRMVGHPDENPYFADAQLVSRPGDDKMYLYYRYSRRFKGAIRGAHDYSIRLRTTTDPERGWSDSQIILKPKVAGIDKIETEEAQWIDGQFVLMTIEYGLAGQHRVYVSANGKDYQPTTLPSLSQHVSALSRPDSAASLSGLLADGEGKLRFLNTVGYTDSKRHYTQWIHPAKSTRSSTTSHE